MKPDLIKLQSQAVAEGNVTNGKLIPGFLVSHRDRYHARRFMDDLAGRLANPVQLSSDAMQAYPEAVDYGFGSDVDYLI